MWLIGWIVFIFPTLCFAQQKPPVKGESASVRHGTHYPWPSEAARQEQMSVGAWCAGAEPAQDVQNLVDQLRSEKPEVRNEARRKLKEAGRAALPALERAARDSDLDAASTAKELLRILPLMEKLSPALRTAIPGVEERLALGGDEEWTRAFLAANAIDLKSSKRLHPDIATDDLELLAGPALRGADPDQALTICRILMRQPVRTAAPELAKRLRNPSCESFALSALSELPIPETLEALLRLLKEDAPAARMAAAKALSRLHCAEGGPPLVALLSDPNEEVQGAAIRALGALRYRPAGPALRKCLGIASQRICALEALGKVRCKEATAEIAQLLEAKEVLVRGAAADALGEIGAQETAPRIAKLLLPHPNDQEKYAIRQALAALGRLGAKDALPLIRTYVSDPDVGLQWSAAYAMGALGDRESAGLLVPLLASPDVSVSGAARHALRRLRAAEQVPQIVALMKNDPALGMVAASTLADLRTRDATGAIALQLESPNPYMRAFAADALCRLGSDQGTTILLEHRDIIPTLLSLNALRQPQLWAKLEEIVLRESPEGCPVQLLKSVARELGMKLDISQHFQQDELPNLPSPCNTFWVFPWHWGPSQPLDVFEQLTGRTNSVLILEPGQLRWLSREEGRSFWKTWLEERAKSGK